jgi:hypothetical protein
MHGRNAANKGSDKLAQLSEKEQALTGRQSKPWKAHHGRPNSWMANIAEYVVLLMELRPNHPLCFPSEHSFPPRVIPWTPRMISFPRFPPVACLPRSVLRSAYRTITDRLPVFLAKTPLMEESLFQCVSPSSRVVVVSTIPDRGEEKQVNFDDSPKFRRFLINNRRF